MDSKLLHLKNQLPDYALIDSGDGAKLERFGKQIVSRMSSQCIWKKKQPTLWEKAVAAHDGKDWLDRRQPELASIDVHGVRLALESQPNGQIGFFPEHSSYLPLLDPFLSQESRVLNLFAYTGLASLYCLSKGAQVTHVDLATHAIAKFQKMVEDNKLSTSKVRTIKEEAITYLGREVKREQRYDIVIADPPSFSRMSKTKFWQIEDILADLMSQCLSVSRKAVVITCHHPGVTHRMLKNVALDVIPNNWIAESSELLLEEEHSERCIGAGDFLLLRLSTI